MSKPLTLGTERVTDNSDQVLTTLLAQLKAATDPEAIRQLSADIERVIFHKQDRVKHMDAVEAIWAGIEAAEQGRVKPARKALAELQEKLGIPG